MVPGTVFTGKIIDSTRSTDTDNTQFYYVNTETDGTAATSGANPSRADYGFESDEGAGDSTSESEPGSNHPDEGFED